MLKRALLIFILFFTFHANASYFTEGKLGFGWGQGHVKADYSFAADAHDQKDLGGGSFLGSVSGGYLCFLGNLVLGLSAEASFMNWEGAYQEHPLNLLNHTFKLEHYFNLGGLLHIGWNLGRILPYLQIGPVWGRFYARSHNREEASGVTCKARDRWGFKFSLGSNYQLIEDSKWYLGAALSYTKYQSFSMYATGMEATYRMVPNFVGFSFSLKYIF